jgi:hypothetical protein
VIRMVGMVFPKAPLLLGQSGLSQSCQENVFEPVVKDRSIPIRVLFDANDAAIVIVRRQSQGFSKLSCGAVRVASTRASASPTRCTAREAHRPARRTGGGRACARALQQGHGVKKDGFSQRADHVNESSRCSAIACAPAH